VWAKPLGEGEGQVDQCERDGGQQGSNDASVPVHDSVLHHAGPGEFFPDVPQQGTDDQGVQQIVA
jgi:hypothetical protein